MNSVTIDSQNSPAWWMRLIFGRHPRRTLIRLVLLVGLSVLLFKFLLLPIQVSGLSMEPTYINGKINFINRLSYAWSKPQRGDVVAIRSRVGNELLLKRIVGLPGETVAMQRGVVFINGERLEEPYVKLRGSFQMPEFKLEEDHYFVIGDNRGVSVYFPVPIWKILGKVLF